MNTKQIEKEYYHSATEELVSYGFPERIYHYTSVENLALILKNKCIRFSRLDTVNDPDEASCHIPAMSKAIFASCWTKTHEESIPLWKMYSDDLSGVRIGMPTLMFKSNKWHFTAERRILFLRAASQPNNVQMEFSKALKIPGPHTTPYSGAAATIDYILGPSHVMYTDACMDTNYFSTQDTNMLVDDTKIGLLKRRAWEFENEIRFLIIPFNHFPQNPILDERLIPLAPAPRNVVTAAA